jgi:hypothetical protein
MVHYHLKLIAVELWVNLAQQYVGIFRVDQLQSWELIKKQKFRLN